MRKILMTLCMFGLLSSALRANDRATEIVGGVINAGLATWGYVEARQHKEVRVYINVMAVICTLKSIGCFVRAVK